MLPFARASELLADLCGCTLSEGTLLTAIQACAASLEGTEAVIKAALQQAAVAHMDETGLDVAGKRQWLHVVSTASLTHYACHARRGSAAMDTIGILLAFEGTSVQDGWRGYWTYGCEHALCNAHHLRELTYLHEQEGQAWAAAMRTLLQRMYVAVEQAKAAQATQRAPEAVARSVTEYRVLVERGLAAQPPPPPPVPGERGRRKQTKAKKLLDRLVVQRDAVLAFLHDFAVPCDNNQAERDVRMVKVQQKVSGGFRTAEGAACFLPYPRLHFDDAQARRFGARRFGARLQWQSFHSQPQHLNSHVRFYYHARGLRVLWSTSISSTGASLWQAEKPRLLPSGRARPFGCDARASLQT